VFLLRCLCGGVSGTPRENTNNRKGIRLIFLNWLFEQVVPLVCNFNFIFLFAKWRRKRQRIQTWRHWQRFQKEFSFLSNEVIFFVFPKVCVMHGIWEMKKGNAMEADHLEKWQDPR